MVVLDGINRVGIVDKVYNVPNTGWANVFILGPISANTIFPIRTNLMGTYDKAIVFVTVFKKSNVDV